MQSNPNNLTLIFIYINNIIYIYIYIYHLERRADDEQSVRSVHHGLGALDQRLTLVAAHVPFGVERQDNVAPAVGLVQALLDAAHAVQSPEVMLKAVAVSQVMVGEAVGGGKSVPVKVELMQMLKPSSL